jgi:hypothetical protein
MERSAARKVAASPALGSKPAPAVSSPVLVGPRPPNPVAPVPMPVPVPMPLPVVPPVPAPAPGVKVPVPGVPPIVPPVVGVFIPPALYQEINTVSSVAMSIKNKLEVP